MNREDELAHFGVIGMKWGVRRAENKIKVLELKEQKTQARTKAKNMAKKQHSAAVRRVAKEREALLKKNYAGKTTGTHIGQALSTAILTEIGGITLTMMGYSTVGVALARAGNTVAIGQFAGNMYNQRKYDNSVKRLKK